jgi:hypothetical protein
MIEIVKSLGGPPKEHPAAYWKKARRIWNALEREQETREFHDEWRVTRRRYVRLLEKLQKLGIDVAAWEAWIRTVQRVSGGHHGRLIPEPIEFPPVTTGSIMQ